MRTSRTWVWLACGVISLGWALSCTQTEQQYSPGALPSRTVSGVAPRLNATTYFAHGHLLERQNNFEDAVIRYRQALELMPDFLMARNRLGITLNKLGRHDDACAEFRRAIAQRPQLAHLHNNLGFSLYLAGKYDEAEVTLRRALELNPSFARAHVNCALVLAEGEHYEEAFSEFCLAGSEADAHYNMAMILTEASRYADAARALDNALQLAPKFEAARHQLRAVARLAAEQEALRAAEAVVAESLADEPTPAAASEPLVPEAGLMGPPAEPSAVVLDESEPSPAEPLLVAEDLPLPSADKPGQTRAQDTEKVRDDTTLVCELFDGVIEAMLSDSPWWEDLYDVLADYLAPETAQAR
ncbi:MAG: tetratricopeptide repeat protein [Planctomycetes bacterium]|nr:tetratricopeptide repeat protein [Planctomycetota bacterium]